MINDTPLKWLIFHCKLDLGVTTISIKSITSQIYLNYGLGQVKVCKMRKNMTVRQISVFDWVNQYVDFVNLPKYFSSQKQKENKIKTATNIGQLKRRATHQ